MAEPGMDEGAGWTASGIQGCLYPSQPRGFLVPICVLEETESCWCFQAADLPSAVIPAAPSRYTMPSSSKPFNNITVCQASLEGLAYGGNA